MMNDEGPAMKQSELSGAESPEVREVRQYVAQHHGCTRMAASAAVGATAQRGLELIELAIDAGAIVAVPGRYHAHPLLDTLYARDRNEAWDSHVPIAALGPTEPHHG